MSGNFWRAVYYTQKNNNINNSPCLLSNSNCKYLNKDKFSLFTYNLLDKFTKLGGNFVYTFELLQEYYLPRSIIYREILFTEKYYLPRSIIYREILFTEKPH